MSDSGTRGRIEGRRSTRTDQDPEKDRKKDHRIRPISPRNQPQSLLLFSRRSVQRRSSRRRRSESFLLELRLDHRPQNRKLRLIPSSLFQQPSMLLICPCRQASDHANLKYEGSATSVGRVVRGILTSKDTNAACWTERGDLLMKCQGCGWVTKQLKGTEMSEKGKGKEGFESVK